MITELVRGKSVSQTPRITKQDFVEAPGGLPEENVHCAALVVNALRQVPEDYLALKNKPWEKA